MFLPLCEQFLLYLDHIFGIYWPAGILSVTGVAGFTVW